MLATCDSTVRGTDKESLLIGAVGHAFSHQRQHADLPFAQPRQRIDTPGPIHERLDDLGIDRRSPRRHPAQGGRESVDCGDPFLQQIAHPGGIIAQQAHGVLSLDVLAQHHDPDVGEERANLQRRLQAVQAHVGRHPDVGHHHIGDKLAHQPEKLVGVGRLPDHLETLFPEQAR